MFMSNDRRNGTDQDNEGGIPAWMVTFSDLATLLLTFFVLLLSMSSMDDKTLKSLFANFTASCGILNFKELGEIYHPKEVLIDGIYDQLQEAMMIKRADDPPKFPSESDVDFIHDIGSQLILENHEDGFKLVFGHQLMFSSGKADMKEEMKTLLAKVAKFIKRSSYQIYIDGHTDNIPIKSKEYPSNTALSLARSYNILKYLVQEEGVSPRAIALAGYGENHPLSPNDNPDGRAQNRRVEIIFKNKTYF